MRKFKAETMDLQSMSEVRGGDVEVTHAGDILISRVGQQQVYACPTDTVEICVDICFDIP